MSAMLAETRPDEATAVVEAPRRERKRVVIIGGGFAGIAAAHALRHADAEVVLIDRRNHHIFQPLLYQVATAVLSPAEIAAPIRQLEVKQPNLSVLLAEVTGVDVASRIIEASSPGVGVRKIAFDYLVVATGMRPSYFGHDEFARYAPGLKNLSDAETIRAKILGAFELAATTEDESERARQMTFVLVGAGPTGVGLAASPIPKLLGTKIDRAGRALVDPFLKVVDAPGVFVVGDAASVMQNEHPVPGVAQAAIQEGRYVGRLIAKELMGRKVKRPFRYFDKGNMAVVGKNYAVLERGS